VISDPVERWHRRLGDSTWEAYSWYWQKFLKFAEVADPEKLLDLSSREASDLAVEFFDFLKSQGYSTKSCSLGYTTVRSFFTHNGVQLEKFGKKFSGYVQYEEGYLVTQQQVFQLIEAIPKWRNKFVTGLCFQGGQRSGIATALKLKHIETRNWQSARIVVFAVPRFLPNAKGRNVNKYNIKYRFAVLDDVARYLVLHLQKREKNGEVIMRDSWLLRSLREKMPPSRSHISEVVKEAAERIGIQRYTQTSRGQKKALVHPHIGRIYFKTQMRQAGVDPELRDFMMGHKPEFGGAYDKYVESEIVNAMEQARTRLALVPERLSRLEQRKQNLIDAIKTMSPEQVDLYTPQIIRAQTDDELNEVIDSFKNGRVKLEPVRR